MGVEYVGHQNARKIYKETINREKLKNVTNNKNFWNIIGRCKDDKFKKICEKYGKKSD